MKLRKVAAALAAAVLITGLTTSCTEDKTGTLLIWDSGLLTKSTEDGKVDAAKSFLHQAADRFEQDHPGVTVEIVTTTGDISANSAQFQAASIAGNGPDIRTAYTGGNTTSFADFLLDLDGTFDEQTTADLTGWNTVRKGYTEEGELLGLPYGGGSYFYVFYSKKKAAAAGLDLSTPPATWEDLLADAEKVKQSGETPFWMGNQEGYVGAWVIAALVGGQLGGTAFTDMFNGTVPLDDPAMLKAYQAYTQLFSRKLTNPDAGSVGNGDAAAGFIQGKGVFFISGGWDNAVLDEALGDDVGVFPIPMLGGARYPAAVAGGPNVAVSITNYSKKQELAKDFLRFMATPEMIDTYVRLFQTEPSNSKRADSSVITNPLLKTEAETLKQADAVVFPYDNVMPQSMIDLFYKVNASTFIGSTTPEDAVKQLKDAGAKELGQR